MGWGQGRGNRKGSLPQEVVLELRFEEGLFRETVKDLCEGLDVACEGEEIAGTTARFMVYPSGWTVVKKED